MSIAGSRYYRVCFVLWLHLSTCRYMHIHSQLSQHCTFSNSPNILWGKTMNNSSAIKVNSSIPSAEVCCLPLSPGSAIMVVIFACLHSSTHQALSSPILEYTIAAYFGHCWLDRNNDLRAFGRGNSREKSLSTRVCASLELVYSLLANFAVPRRLCILWLSVQTAS